MQSYDTIHRPNKINIQSILFDQFCSVKAQHSICLLLQVDEKRKACKERSIYAKQTRQRKPRHFLSQIGKN